MSEPALFDMEPTVPVPAPDAGTVEERRRARQLARIRNGFHPLGENLRLHEQADRNVEPYKGREQPYRCGTCVHRRLVGGHAKSFPKCDAGGWSRATNGPGTDVKAWWPGCTEYEATPELGSDNHR